MELKTDDEIFGWLFFDAPAEIGTSVFDDSVPDINTQAVIDAPLAHGSTTKVDKAHTIVNYQDILEHGLTDYQKKIDDELRVSPHDEYLFAMKDSLLSIETLVKRMKQTAMQNANGCKNAEEIANALTQVPFRPARNFREAIQSVWIIHFLLPVAEHAFFSISLGRFDRYMYPYYQKSREDGMSREDAKRILRNFYKLLNSYADGACLLNVGEPYNELSELLIECQRDFSLPAPILGARVSSETPEHIWNMLIDEKLFSRGQPTFYSEKACAAALAEKGIPQEEIRNFANSSCMGISIPGEEFNSMWGCVFSVSAVLESALNCGEIFSKGVTVPGIPPVGNLTELYAAFERSAKYLLDLCAASYEAKSSISEKTDPDPFVSLLTAGCIEKHCDRISGAKYHNVTVECMGMINVSDGICAIDTLVFQDKKYTVEQFNEAVRDNFAGYENLRNDIMQCPKYGQNAGADSYTVSVAEILQKAIRRKSKQNRIYSPSLHTLDANIRYGNNWGAGYDGRLAGQPFAKNAASSDWVTKNPTSLVLSAAKLPQMKFFGGQPIDLNFSTETVRNHKKELAALIRTYAEMGGLQMQVNSMNAAILKDAVAHPERHNDLVVRIGGYSLYFNRLSDATKQNFILRAEAEEGNL